MTLHVVLRTTAKENRKPRPPGLDKLVCLLSVLRAVEVARAAGTTVELVHLCDGVPPGPRGTLLAGSGEILDRSLTLEQSYASAVRLPAEREWPKDDLVYLCEDDHLHRPEALKVLAAAASARPATDYFALYAAVDGRAPTGAPLEGAFSPPRTWVVSPRSLVVDGTEWRRALSTTSSFAARVQALQDDLAIHLVGHRTRGVDGAHDHPICLALQGHPPFSWTRPVRHLLSGDEPVARRLKHGVWDASLDLLALRARRRRREILAPVPALSTHAEMGWLARGTDWAEVAEQARDRG